jgi:TRAP-type C4-dicarboxylate transport system substrate-binding protein
MPEKYRVYIKKALQVARYHQNRMVLEQEAELIGKFEKEFGMEIIIPDKQAFMEHAKEFYSQDKFQEMWGEGMYSKIQTME